MRYIGSLLIGLFYFDSIIHSRLLDSIPKKLYGIYLQEYIKCNIIKKVRRGDNICPENINTIMMICSNLGYDGDSVNDFYKFLMDISDCTLIDVDKINQTNKILSTSISSISLSLLENKQVLSVKDMLHDYVIRNKINNIPPIIALDIDRFRDNKILTNDIIIQYCINPFRDLNSDNLLMHEIKWRIHCIICHRKSDYYVVLYDDSNKKWYLFDEYISPISMNDRKITSSIKKECIFIVFKLCSL